MSAIKKRSKLQEKRIAEDLGGKVQKASGATDFAKGDVRAKDLLIEAKTTGQKSYRVDVGEITKIQAEALERGASNWAMQIEFQGQLGHNKKVAVIDWQTFLDLRANSDNLEKLYGRLDELKEKYASPDSEED